MSRMRIGLVAETKPAERRVALTDTGVGALLRDGHEVLVERGAGAALAGATLVDTATAWALISS
jgi:alanine dehydrogenase